MRALTVAMPVYNAMPYLPEAVESILDQTFADFEFLIVDDGSNDGSRQYLEEIRDSRVRLYCEERLGLMAARNRLLRLTETDICALMDADDFSMRGRLQAQWDFMRRRPEVVLLGTQIAFIAHQRQFARSLLPTQHSDIVRALIKASPVLCNSSCMFRTDVVRKAGGYQLPRGEDFDLFLRLSEAGMLANLPDRLHTYRIHLASTFTTQYPEYIAHIAYAIASHRQRLADKPEPRLTEFLAAWNNSGPTQRIFRRLDTWSAREFRRALIELGRGRHLRGGLHMVAAAIFRPGSTVRQIASRFIRIWSSASRHSSRRAEASHTPARHVPMS
jgi:glycosyltransferase involved in cell wall biosynthesis